MGFETQDVERKVISILRVLSDCQEPQGARVIAHRLRDHGVELGERAVRYHLKLMDERGLTRLVGRDGRVLTRQGIEELNSALVKDKVGLAISKIELLAFRKELIYQPREVLKYKLAKLLRTFIILSDRTPALLNAVLQFR